MINDVDSLVSGKIKAVHLGTEFNTEASDILNYINNRPESGGGTLPFIPLVRETSPSGFVTIIQGTQHPDIFLKQDLLL